MKALITFLLSALILAGCDGFPRDIPAGERLALRAGGPSDALAGVVAKDSVTAETRRLLDLTGDPVGMDHVSSDGRWAVGTDWDTGDITIRDLEGGEIQNLTRVEDPWGPRFEFGMSGLISPDGAQVVFTWYESGYDRATLRVASLDGEEPEVEPFYVPSGGWPMPLDWSPDGEFLLVSHHAEDGTHELLIVPADGGEPRLLRSLGWSAPQNGGFSPDGEYVAFDFAPDPEAGVREIHVLAREGDRGGPVASGPWDDYFLGWAPDGHILFLSDRGETRGIWRVPVEGARVARDPELVKPDVWRARGLGFDEDGRFYYNLISGTPDVHVATLDLDAGRVVVPPAVAVPREIAGTHNPVWSPDGQRLAYLAERTPWGGGVLSDRVLMIRALDTGDVQRIPLPARSQGENLQGWSADGRWLLLRVQYDRAGRSLLRVDVHTGEVERFPMDGVFDLADFVVHPDGEHVVAWRTDDASDSPGRGGRLLLINLQEGDERVVFEFEGQLVGPGQVVPSPDGEKVAIVLLDDAWEAPTIRVHSLKDGEGRVVLDEQEELEVVRNLTWTAEGSALLYTPPPEPGEDVPVWRIALRDTELDGPRQVALLPPATRQLAPHPDGRRIAFQAGSPTWELWVMENIGPVVERTADGTR